MRTNLQVPFAEKEAAKALGARWDGALKVWYVKDVEDLMPFGRWMARTAALFTDSPYGENTKVNQLFKPDKPATGGSAITTSPAVAHCGCDVLPWLHCMHTEARP